MNSVHLNGRYDLHTHTQASDGMNTPAENVRLAKQKGLAGLAITDHDTVSGIPEAMEAGKQTGLDVIPGVEISTRASEKDVHILGYFLQYEDEQLCSRLEQLRTVRETRNERILEKLNELGIAISMSEVISGLGRELGPDDSVGRPHIADVLVRKGVVADLREAFDKYLAEGAAAYVSLPRVGPVEAIAWIKEAGGAAVIAHPGLYGDDDLVRHIIKEGQPSGIEVYHSDHGPGEEMRYSGMAREYGLLMTGGSDYHGVRQGQVFHGDLGSRSVTADVLEQLQARAGRP
ncbi:PHP domain-containing protein [Paenibacillus sp. YPG26]|uniref:PHP domain-containing protein n=1 Tax=Paenibacillus sp. YPG26 TaxID=2878915 RepID=UPI00203C8AD8|nr:PHP domain-containing protein [Paenibacillus sp. YPG26]USB34598.1 PHP domain-containing protein [Paenibacillus sp. YPG26]